MKEVPSSCNFLHNVLWETQGMDIIMKILITAVGRRVQLVKHLSQYFQVIGVDCSDIAPAAWHCDKFYRIPSVNNKSYIDMLLSICSKEKINVLLPLYEKEFFIIESSKKYFDDLGTYVMLSNKKVIEICNDKWKTYMFFVNNNIKTAESFLKAEKFIKYRFPLFIKPRVGMGSEYTYKINDEEELFFYYKRINEPIIQEYLEGDEYTFDCFCDSRGVPVSIVPRIRLEVRAGESSKTRIVRSNKLIDKAKEVCEKLNAIGPITIQGFKVNSEDIVFTEINSRIAGGVPITIEAGVCYGRLIESMVKGKELRQSIGEYRELTMLRYDEAVFV